jgi:folylpolyglutamate synthase/dihydropteroate synthase
MGNSVGEALMRALEDASRDDLICVTGSLYTVGEAEKVLKR